MARTWTQYMSRETHALPFFPRVKESLCGLPVPKFAAFSFAFPIFLVCFHHSISLSFFFFALWIWKISKMEARERGSMSSSIGNSAELEGNLTLSDRLKVFKGSTFDPEAYVTSKCQRMNEKVLFFQIKPLS